MKGRKNYNETYNFNTTTMIILSNILFCNYSFIFLTLPTVVWALWKQELYSKKLTVLGHIILCIIHIRFVILGLVSEKVCHGALAGVAQWTERQAACEPKGHGFNSWSGHTPGLRARSPVSRGDMRGNHILMFLSLFLSLFPFSENK